MKKLSAFQKQKKNYINSLKRLNRQGKLTVDEYNYAMEFAQQARQGRTLKKHSPYSFAKVYSLQKEIEKKEKKVDKMIAKLEKEKDVIFLDSEKDRLKNDIKSGKTLLSPSKLAKEYGRQVNRETGELERVNGRLRRNYVPRIDYYDLVYRSFMQNIASGSKSSFRIMKAWSDRMTRSFGVAEFAKMLERAFNDGYIVSYEILYDGTVAESYLSRLIEYFANKGYIGQFEKDSLLEELGSLEFYNDLDDELYNEVHRSKRLT